jgi:hypothetical protein
MPMWAAVQRFGITYLVILDSTMELGMRGNNWPRYYLIDTQGNIERSHRWRYDQITKFSHYGWTCSNGAKEISLIKANNTNQTRKFVLCRFKQSTTPEIYMDIIQWECPLEIWRLQTRSDSFSIPSTTNLKPDIVYLQGKKNNPDNMITKWYCIVLKYYAKSVNIIAGEGWRSCF